MSLRPAQATTSPIRADGREPLVREPLERMMERLDPAVFMRIHRSTVVALRDVAAFEPDRSGDGWAILRSGERLKVSRRYRAALKARLMEPQ